jgi:Nucleoside diphosphate kinase
VKQHYREHEGKSFFEGLVRHFASGPVVLMVWEGPDAIAGELIMHALYCCVLQAQVLADGTAWPYEAMLGSRRKSSCLQVCASSVVEHFKCACVLLIPATCIHTTARLLHNGNAT